jgi:CubicO group peptidase (beta-lactamase class C family)
MIDGYIRSFPRHEEFSGVVLVADGDRILFHKGYGLANRELGVPNGEKTRFQIGSVTKAFTAMLVLKQVEAGILDLDRTIGDYLPFYPEKTGRSITVRNLLSNTSGIPHNYRVHPEYFSKDDHYFHTPRELLELFWDAPLRHAPGEEFTYSSPGFYILGAILQQMTGKSYAELLRENITAPLNMTDTFVENNRTTDVNLATGYVRGLSGLVKAYVEDKSTALAAGDILSTALDLFRWQRVLNRKGDRILSESSKQLMFQPILPNSKMTFVGPHFKIPYNGGKSTLEVSVLSGSSSGYATCLSCQTEHDRCVIVLSNIGSDDVNRIADDIGDFFTRWYLGVAVGPKAPTTRSLPRAAAVSPSELSKVTGFYLNRDGIYTGVVKDGNRLFYLDFEKGSGLQIAFWELTPLDGGHFQLSHNPSFRCDLAAEPGAGIIRLSASRNGRTFNTAERCIPDTFEVSAYAGVFTSLELQKSFRVEVADTVLKVRDFLGERKILLVPLEKDLFGFPRGFIRFHRDAQGSLDGFDVFTKDTDRMFGSRFIKIVY